MMQGVNASCDSVAAVHASHTAAVSPALCSKLSRFIRFKLTVPCKSTAVPAVQSNVVYLPKEALLVSSSFASRQINADR